MKNRRRRNSRDEPLRIVNSRDGFAAIQQFVDMNKQENISIKPIENPRIERIECRDNDNASNTQRVSNQEPQVTRTVRGQRSESIDDQLYPRVNANHREKTLKPPSLKLEVDIMPNVELQIEQLFSQNNVG
ncbi:hypothetical protein ACH5RR_029083 [Cinchona calisaya]|uniref:Uncharacterized protein n=1 Tax=Cinchona calisaya TaxID=153742 RepID=A0ABD2YQM7_9GENT